MRRREFITLLGSAAVWPLGARAQQALPLIGYLGGGSASSATTTRRASLAGFFQGLADQGYIEDRNFSVEYRWAEDHYDRLPELAADLVSRRVALIVVSSTPGALAAKAATQTIPIPIVYLVGTDPVKVGLAASLSRPGGNLTGVTIIATELMSKCIQLMHDLVPAATTLAILVNPANAVETEAETREVQAAARLLGLRLVILPASSASEIDAAFATLLNERAAGLVVSGEAFFLTQADQLVALAARHAVPTITQDRVFTAVGGLMNYGPNPQVHWRVVGAYAGRILKGEKPADLPVQQLTRMELVINMKTAKALGLTVSPSLLAIADEVIE